MYLKGCCASRHDREFLWVSIPFKRESVSQVSSCDLMRAITSSVSIPFKRESVSQADEVGQAGAGDRICFNSLQTGKCISSTLRPYCITLSEKFQFPSNGKVYLKLWLPFTHHDNPALVGFHSLQTGKCISSYWLLIENSQRLLFQFPSNGKVYLKEVATLA